jgi:hypothetical protein
MGLKALPACLIVSALFLFNNPLVRTIKFNQINVWILNCFLLATLWVPHRPFLSGWAVALGAHIKLYTFSLLLPWVTMRRWRAILGVGASFAAILVVQIGSGQNPTLWGQFLGYFIERVEKPSHYRNSGIWSFVYNLVKVPATFTESDYFNWVPSLVAMINLVLIAWFVWRILQRQELYSKLADTEDGHTNKLSERYLQYSHAIDAIALGIFISPSVWEHHYVLAIPVALWAIVTQRWDQPWLVGAGVFLIFCLPTFDVFPLAHHRMLGLIILVYATSPHFLHSFFSKEVPHSSVLDDKDGCFMTKCSRK